MINVSKREENGEGGRDRKRRKIEREESRRVERMCIRDRLRKRGLR